MTLNDLGQADWYMDIGATSHLHSNAGILKSISDKSSNYSSVLVGNRSLIPVTKMGHTSLSLRNPYHNVIFKLKVYIQARIWL